MKLVDRFWPVVLLALLVACGTTIEGSCSGTAVIEEGDAAVPTATDAGNSDGGAADAGEPDIPDAGESDSGLADAGLPDAGSPDAGTDPDAGTTDPTDPPKSDSQTKVTVRSINGDIGEQVVSFGLPLPPGTLLNASNIRVRDSEGDYYPVYTESLGPWRQTPPKKFLCGEAPADPGLRSVLIQFPVDTANLSEDFFIEFGEPSGVDMFGENFGFVTDKTPIKDTWQITGSFLYTQADEIYQPKLLVERDLNWLACANVTPLMGLSGNAPEMQYLDEAQKNFFYSYINDFRNHYTDLPNSRPVTEEGDMVDLDRSSNNAWLYDRATTMYNVYMRTGRLDMLSAAHRAAYDYRKRLWSPERCAAVGAEDTCVGFFDVKNPSMPISWGDTKYSYAETMALAYWFTGWRGYKDAVAWVYDAWTVSSPAMGGTDITRPGRFYTERHSAYNFLGVVYYYELFGDQEALDILTQGVDVFRTIQTTPTSEGKVVPCFVHDWENEGEGFSPWMTSLMSHSLLKVYHTTGMARVPTMLTDVAQCEVDWALTWAEDNGEQWRIPFYGAAAVGEPRDYDGWYEKQREHALDVAHAIALGAAFSNDPAQRSLFVEEVNNLLDTEELVLNDWTRNTDGRPKYRLAPIRKYAWLFKNSTHSISWLFAGFGDPE